MGKLRRKVWVMMLTLALIISQLLPTGILAITAAAEDGMEMEEMKKEAPAEEEKKAEAAPAEEKKVEAAAEEKKAEAAAEEKKADEKAEAVKAEAMSEMKEELKDVEAKEILPAEELKEKEKIEVLPEEAKEELAEKEEEKEEETSRYLFYFSENNDPVVTDPVAYYEYNGESQTLYPTFTTEEAKKYYDNHFDSKGRMIIKLADARKCSEEHETTFYATVSFKNVVAETNAGSYESKFSIVCTKIEDSKGNDVTANLNASGFSKDPEYKGPYALADGAPYKAVIKAREISVRFNTVSKVYGEADPAKSGWATVTKGSLVKGDDISKILILDREQGEDVGEYPFWAIFKMESLSEAEILPAESKKAAKSVAKKEAAEKEYADYKEKAEEKEKVVEADLIPAAEVKPYKIGNYSVTFENKEGVLKITPATLTITAIDNGKTKGTADPTLKVDVNGLVNGESLPDGFYKHWRTAGEEIGTYPINLSINSEKEEVKEEAKEENKEELKEEFKEVEELKEELKEEYKEEVAKEEWAVAKEVFPEALEEAVEEKAYEYACKSVKKVAEKASEKVELERIDSIAAIEKIEAIEKIDDIEEKEAVEKIEDIEKIDDIVKPENGFKASNYEIRLVPGVFTITGKSAAATVSTGSSDNNGGGNNGGANSRNSSGSDIAVADVNDAAAPAAAPAAPAATTAIPDAATPLAGGNGAWALVNLICAVLTALGAVVAIFRRKEEEDGDDDIRRKMMFAATTAGILTAIAAVDTFLLTEDMSLPMILIDKWTVLMVIMLAVQILAAALNKKAAEAEEEAEAETAAAE